MKTSRASNLTTLAEALAAACGSLLSHPDGVHPYSLAGVHYKLHVSTISIRQNARWVNVN
jgi:hypothetical protein